jgi:16S rRNA (adenine1518-N6/adenine1519-N6)-dimethyltransferase
LFCEQSTCLAALLHHPEPAVMKLSEIEATLREIRVAPVKTLGQNFLHDQNLARWIVEKAKITSGDYVVEIGPGLGALTELMVDRGARVLAIEKDRRLANFLANRFCGSDVEIQHGDAIEFDVRNLFAQSVVKCVGNLPYYIASQLLIRFVEYPSPISLYLFMLQKEMAQRLSAQPASEDYGALSVVIQSRYHVHYLRTVPATVFLPQPGVDSALVQLMPRPAEELPPFHDETFRKLINRGFSQRRKQLQKLLREEVPEWGDAAMRLGIDPKVRGEELSLQQWIALSNFVRPTPEDCTQNVALESFSVVDKNDRWVRDAPRTEVHGNKLRHRAVHILVFNAKGDVFLQKRSRSKDRHPLLWDSSAAGHVSAGEEYDEAALRELGEELGISTELKRIAKLPASDQTGQEFIWLYRGGHDGPFQLAPAEIEYGDFFPVTLVSDWISARPNDFAPGFLTCWNAYQSADVNPRG